MKKICILLITLFIFSLDAVGYRCREGWSYREYTTTEGCGMDEFMSYV